MSTALSSKERLVFWLGGIVLFAFLLYVLRGVVVPFVAGLAVAYFLDPVADRLEKLGLSRGIAAALLLAVFFAALGGAGVVLFPLLQTQVAGLVSTMPEMVDSVQQWVMPMLAQLQENLTPEEMERLKGAVGSYAGDAVHWLGSLLGSLWDGGKAVFGALSLVLIMPLVAFFMLRDWDHLVMKFDGLLPRASANIIRERFREIDQTVAGFVRGQAIVCIVLGTIYGVGLSIVGLDFGLLIGLGTGMMAFVPYVGMAIGSLVAFGVALTQFSDVLPFVWVAAVFIAGQTLDAAFLTPNLVGGRVGLHPVWIIFALMTGGTIFGFAGVLLAVPTAAVIGVLVRFAIASYQKSTLYLGGDGSPS